MLSRNWVYLGVIALILGGIAQVLSGQGVQKRIQFPEYDRTTGKVKSLLIGEKATPQKNGLILVEKARLETYVYDGTTRNIDLIIRAPRCFFNFSTRVASSAGPMMMRRADGQAMMEGRGFVWEQRGSTLVISNDVRTVTKNGFSANMKND
jgi:hypothetical protein|tara:strand:+ start:434 stop:886 length:453 start_codon:yes stop_codon:yes gene_type:complete